MSFANYPAALPYFAELHDDALLEKLIAKLGHGDLVDVEKKMKDLTIKHPFMDAFDQMASEKLTTNGALTHGTTTSPVLDFYYGVEAVKAEGKDAMIRAAWESDPLATVHIIFYARSIHRGKSLIQPFFQAYGWLLIHHPRTALANLHLLIDGTVRTDAELQKNRKAEKVGKRVGDDWDVVEEEYELLERRDFKTHGYWKDLCTLLTIYCQGEIKGPDDKTGQYAALHWPRAVRDKNAHNVVSQERKARYNARLEMSPEEKAKDLERCKQQGIENNKKQLEDARQKRLEERKKRNQTVCDLLEKDKTYRALHFTVAKTFANQLKKDMEQLDKNKTAIESGTLDKGYGLGYNISLAAKWAPSLGNSHDKHTFLATSIAEILFPPQSHQDSNEDRDHYLNKVRELYRKQYLVPLRAAIDITEHYKAPGKWDKVNFRHVPSVCLQQNLGLFYKHAPDTVTKYMDGVAAGNKKVSGATLGPHLLVDSVRNGGIPPKLADALKKVPGSLEKYMESQKNMINGQWETLIGSIRDTSLLKSGGKDKKRVDLGECIAVCDVSGSMMAGNPIGSSEKQPLDAAIGLSLIVTNLAKPPFNGAVITFTSNPYIFKVDTNATFTEQVNTIMKSEMGFSTDLCKVFTNVLLPMAKKHNLAPEDMVKRIFIFTDMEFDACHNGMGELMNTQDFIRKQYKDAGYEMPELVWWNLCTSSAYSSSREMTTPATKDDAGVSLLSGFSASMVKTFLDGDVADGDDKDTTDKGDHDEKKNDTDKKPKDTPQSFMRKAIFHESFDKIVVID